MRCSRHMLGRFPTAIAVAGATALLTASGPRVRAGDASPTDAATMAIRVARLGEQVRELAGEKELLDTLYYGWRDRPYGRATLAILIKTTDVLTREVDMRRAGNGAIADRTALRMMTWAEAAVERAAASEPDYTFRPHRKHITTLRIRQTARPQPLFVFIDRATSTRHHADFGDHDLLASLGLRVYARLIDPLSDANILQLSVQRTSALGMAPVLIGPSTADARADTPTIEQAGTVVPVSLAALLSSGAPATTNSGIWPALRDPVFAEAWPSSLARRGLARGALRQQRCLVANWQAPFPRLLRDQRGKATAAAMWMHAIDGQGLGMVPGWRDLRDGSASPHASLFTDPATLEHMAHANLRLLRLANTIAQFSRGPALAIAVGPEAIDKVDGNRWAKWTEAVWEQLAIKQIPFDVTYVHGNPTTAARAYETVVPLGAGDADAFVQRVERLLDDAASRQAGVSVRELDGTWPRDLFARVAQTKSGTPSIAIVNLSNDDRQVMVKGALPERNAIDKVSGESVARPTKSVSLAPWQVRILEPASR